MTLIEYISLIFLLIGAFFFLAGTLGLLRFPDVYTRLHALTKADNIGLGFIVLGLALQSDSLVTVAKLILIWVLVLLSGASVAHLVAKSALDKGIRLWK
ncbi:MAG: Na(+) H(+) antiporter subunit G [uncultured Sulfurovum sp.]|uniref:Na(+) H(+) antiporter subunit G n=1 Tax=uncultured Sulfurovum sp. TaxID=269237 RepID=A0A6S6SPF3_9BACT|nr:MAG: Na(+) H(+) antiporter subunit G [uncultured Sulfurovum sp.]